MGTIPPTAPWRARRANPKENVLRRREAGGKGARSLKASLDATRRSPSLVRIRLSRAGLEHIVDIEEVPQLQRHESRVLVEENGEDVKQILTML